MRLFKLLEELCVELKAFNANVKRLSEPEKKRKYNGEFSEGKLDPQSFFIPKNEFTGRKWVEQRLKERGITFLKKPTRGTMEFFYGNEVMVNLMHKFLSHDYHQSTYPYRIFVAAAFGYDYFEDLLEAYNNANKVTVAALKEEKRGVA